MQSAHVVLLGQVEALLKGVRGVRRGEGQGRGWGVRGEEEVKGMRR